MSAIPMKKSKSVDELKNIPLAKLRPHPLNPRKIEQRDLIESIASQLREGGFHESHAIMVRPRPGQEFEIISGHNRVAAATLAQLETVPAWVRDLNDEEAYMQLVLCNVERPLHPLERGDHARIAVENGMTLRDYAAKIGTDEKTVHTWKNAAEVVVLCAQKFDALRGHVQHLSLIHAAPKETWPEWVARLIENGWTVEDLREQLKIARPAKAEPPKKQFYKITEWEKLSPAEQAQILATPAAAQFNAQENASIEWARWSWNPVTGCLHNCPYCYARDIAARFYPQNFEPSLIPGALKAPGNTPRPKSKGVGFGNVFVCSMADLFGKWVPAAWIEAVLAEVHANPQWNFLFLTKFPIRMAEFEYPDNAWLGTTVDLQARVKNAERAMAKVKAKVKWVSLEPLLDRIHMDWSLFQWIVLGGASVSSETPAWQPPRRWLWEITMEAQAAGCAVYHKDNVPPRLRDYPGSTEPEREQPPEPFQYLKVIS